MTFNDRTDVEIRLANNTDVTAIRAMVDGAYHKYIERLGKLPAPMTADYIPLVATGTVYVLRAAGMIVGSVVLSPDTDSIKVNNLVVDPAAQGKGYGRTLMDYAEELARSWGLLAITLYTNEKMHENIALYTKLGFTETHRLSEHGFERVYFRRDLS